MTLSSVSAVLCVSYYFAETCIQSILQEMHSNTQLHLKTARIVQVRQIRVSVLVQKECLLFSRGKVNLQRLDLKV